MCYIWGIPVLWSGCWLCTPTKSSFTRSCSGDGSFLKRTLEPRNLAAFSISAFNYRVTMNRIDKWHAEKRAKNHQFVKIKEIMWKQYSCGSMHSMHDLCFFQLENHTSHTTNPWYVVGDKRTTASPAHSLSPAFYLRTSQ